jgi:D-amino acid aminotransferase
MTESVYINGDFVDADKAWVNASDFGLNYGYGLFETMQAYNGKIFLFNKHHKRLADGAAALSIRSPLLKKFIEEKLNGKVIELLKLNRLTETNAYIKIVVTRGTGTKDATIIIFARATEEEKNAELRKRGVEAIIIDEPKRYMPDIKNLNYLPNILARLEAKEQNAYDAIFKTANNLILEGSASNIFIVKDKRVITPPADGSILPGITRQEVIELSKADGLTVVTAPIETGELLNSDEAFLTNSIIEIVPLVKVNSKIIAGGKPGTVTKRIQRLYHDAARVK